jgi:hypothetical protein
VGRWRQQQNSQQQQQQHWPACPRSAYYAVAQIILGRAEKARYIYINQQHLLPLKLGPVRFSTGVHQPPVADMMGEDAAMLVVQGRLPTLPVAWWLSQDACRC